MRLRAATTGGNSIRRLASQLVGNRAQAALRQARAGAAQSQLILLASHRAVGIPSHPSSLLTHSNGTSRLNVDAHQEHVVLAGPVWAVAANDLVNRFVQRKIPKPREPLRQLDITRATVRQTV